MFTIFIERTVKALLNEENGDFCTFTTLSLHLPEEEEEEEEEKGGGDTSRDVGSGAFSSGVLLVRPL